MRASALALLLLVAAGCTSDDTPPEPSTGTASTAPARPRAPRPAAPDTLSMALDAGRVARPVAPVRVEGACPFECCTYGTWTTSAPTRLFATAHDTTQVLATLPAGTALTVPTGHVLLTRLGRAVLREPMTLFRSFEDTVPALAGDTLVVLQTVGEDVYRVWTRGEILEAEGSTLRAAGPGAFAEAQWWARATAPDGRAGWLWMDRTPPVRGADACG